MRHAIETEPAVSSAAREEIAMRQSRIRGFSLLETLAAMFLLALCFGALMKAAGASMALNARATGYTQASLWASGLLDRLYITDFPSTGTHQGHFDDTYRWLMVVSEPPADAFVQNPTPTRFYQIDLTVTWNEDGKPTSAHFVTERTMSALPPRDPASGLSTGGDG